jgi:hypothetical protein
MRATVLGACALLLSAGSAQSAFIGWQGDLFVTAANAGCASTGFSKGDFFRAVYLPRNLGTNGPDTRLSFIGSRHAQRYIKANAAYGNGIWHGTTITGLSAGLLNYNSNMVGAAAAPAVPAATTQTVVLRGTLTNFFGTVGCTVSFSGSLGKQIQR